ncbi:MAG TPA: class I SAM-dependent methyltransferase [Solirubrobacteraceae bacterium]
MKLSQFVPHPDSGVRVPPSEVVPAGYLDGAERYLLEALAQVTDASVGSPELNALMRDWPSLYHLTPYRSTLFDCLGFEAAGDARVLELGAGCGAITRWLGEHFGEVHAVEGSADRARVIQARCAGLDNVSVFSANYSLLEEEDAYDVATLIGVLEYGHLYHPRTRDPHEAALDNIQVACRSLRADGVLVLAIENKLGLKYLSGAREDHSGRPYDSIEGYTRPHANAVTFSARELESMLAAAGFGHAEFFVPFPDYKLATTVVNAAAVRDEHNIHSWLQGTAPDRGHPSRAQLAFNETLAQREIARAGLLRELANSLLVVAYRGGVDAADTRLGLRRDWVARHYSLDRRPECRKRVTLPVDADTVRNEAVISGGRDAATIDLGAFQHHLGDEAFRRGELVLTGVLRAVAASGVAETFHEHIRRLADWLNAERGTGEHDAAGVALVDGAAMDALWWNLVEDADDGSWSEVDREWRFRGNLPVDYVVWRNLLHFFRRFSQDLPQSWRAARPDTFATAQLDSAGLLVSQERVSFFADLERAFALTAAPGPLPELGPTVEALVDDAPRRFRVLALAEEVVAEPDLLRAYAAAFDATEASTLVLRAPDTSTDIVGPLRYAIAAAGLDEETMPDTLLVGAGDPVAATAVLTAAKEWAPDGLPCFSGVETTKLRALAERHWATT